MDIAAGERPHCIIIDLGLAEMRPAMEFGVLCGPIGVKTPQKEITDGSCRVSQGCEAVYKEF